MSLPRCGPGLAIEVVDGRLQIDGVRARRGPTSDRVRDGRDMISDVVVLRWVAARPEQFV